MCSCDWSSDVCSSDLRISISPYICIPYLVSLRLSTKRPDRNPRKSAKPRPQTSTRSLQNNPIRCPQRPILCSPSPTLHPETFGRLCPSNVSTSSPFTGYPATPEFVQKQEEAHIEDHSFRTSSFPRTNHKPQRNHPPIHLFPASALHRANRSFPLP